MVAAIDESIKRIDEAEAQFKKKLIDIVAKRKVQEEKGNHEFMRKNKKNYGDHSEWRSIVATKKYDIYKTEHDSRRHYQSTEKVKRLAPLNEGSRSKRGL